MKVLIQIMKERKRYEKDPLFVRYVFLRKVDHQLYPTRNQAYRCVDVVISYLFPQSIFSEWPLVISI